MIDSADLLIAAERFRSTPEQRRCLAARRWRDEFEAAFAKIHPNHLENGTQQRNKREN